VAPAGAVAPARCELAAELLAGIGHLDAQRREVNKKLAAAVTASGTSLTEVSGVGPVIAATVIGDVITVARFPSRDHFAACNGTAPAGVSRGQRKIHRLSLRGNRRLNHAACYQRKLAEGKTRKEALRCLKRRISDAIYARLRADARTAGPAGQPGNDTGSSVTGSHPGHRLFGQATSGPEHSLRAPATFTQATPAPEPSAKKIQRAT
jgi:transposase